MRLGYSRVYSTKYVYPKPLPNHTKHFHMYPQIFRGTYQLMRGEMSSLTGASTIQNMYHNMDVTMAITNRYPIPNKEEAPGDAMEMSHNPLATYKSLEWLVVDEAAFSLDASSRNRWFIIPGPYHPTPIPTRPSTILWYGGSLR